jgi:hypothetical protein
MSARRAIACVVLLAVIVVPVLGLAGDALSASHSRSHREAGLQHQPPRPWRTIPAAVASTPPVLPALPLTVLESAETRPVLLLFVRTPFVPPRA